MEERFVEVDGIRVRYRDSGGDASVLLFIHGIGQSLEFWQRQAAFFKQDYRVITLDLPGHGVSGMGRRPYEPATFAAFGWAFLDQLGVENVTLVGHSMGGGIALRMAAGRPDAVTKLFLASSATLGREAPLPFRLMTLPVLGEIMSKPGKMTFEQQLKSVFYQPSKSVTPDLRETISRNVMNPELQTAFLKTLRLMTDIGGQRKAMVDESLTALKSLQMPVFYLHGKQDSVVLPQHSVEAQKITANAGIALLEECGHTPQVEQPDAFNMHLSGFLKG